MQGLSLSDSDARALVQHARDAGQSRFPTSASSIGIVANTIQKSLPLLTLW